MADFAELRNMVSSFRVSELQVLLGYAGRNKSGRKHELLVRALHLLKSGCSPAVQIKIKELYRRRYPRTLEGLAHLADIKSVFNLDKKSSVAADLSGAHSLPSTSVTPHSPSSPVGLVLLQDTKSHFDMQLTPIPPVHPDVQMKSLPFYDVLDVLLKPTSLVQSNIQRFQEKFFIFALTPQQVREICISRDFMPGGRRDYTVQVQLRLCLAETSCPQEDNYPSGLCIKVNGKLFPLPGYAPPPKNGIEQKRPGRPLNITSLVRMTSAVPNQISISWASEIAKNYSMSVYLVRQLSAAVLLQKLKIRGVRNAVHSRALIKEKLTADPDSEIATTSLRVSLLCPLGKMRLSIPCRAITCTHLQCFDAALYLQMNEKKPTWVCPVCDKKAVYESLILDGLFMEILNQCSDAEEIKFQEDGSWFPMRTKKETLNLSSPQCTKVENSTIFSKACSMAFANESNRKKVDVIDLTIESSEDEEDPPAKKKCILTVETKESPAKGVFTYQSSTTRVPYLTTIESSSIPKSLDYSASFQRPSMSGIPADVSGLDFLSLMAVDPQYCPSMFLDRFASPLPTNTLARNRGTSASNYESIAQNSMAGNRGTSTTHHESSAQNSTSGNRGTSTIYHESSTQNSISGSRSASTSHLENSTPNSTARNRDTSTIHHESSTQSSTFGNRGASTIHPESSTQNSTSGNHGISTIHLESSTQNSMAGNRGTSTSHHESSTQVSSSSRSDTEVTTSSSSRGNTEVITSSSRADMEVITSSGSSLPDIISLD